MTEDEHRNKVYEILEKKMGWKVDFERNEQGWYDPFIEDCWKEGVSPEACAHGIKMSENRMTSADAIDREILSELAK